MTQDAAAAKAVNGFGAAAKAKLANIAATGQPEDQLRGPIEDLIPALAAAAGVVGEVVLIGETALADLKTRPDYSVTLGAGKAKALIGFIEVKAPGKGFDPRKFSDAHDKLQWTKLKALPNLIYTDGNGVSLWRNGEIVGKPLAFDGDVETAGVKLGAPPGLSALIGDFLSWTPVPPRKPAELAATAARLCRFLRDEVLEQLQADNAQLKGLAADWRALLFPDASDERFADGYAQAVTFGLLMAKSHKLTLSDGLDRIAKELGKTDTLIGAALRLLTEQEVLGPSLDTLVRVLDVVDWDVIAKGDPEAWLYFYEQFLAVYDNKLRKLTGSYYTPPEVVQTMVRLCDEALKSPQRFDRHKGLADPMVQIADPAVGSGTFLLALLRHIATAIEEDQGKPAVGPAMAEVAKRLFGFELQFGAYAVAELRLLAEMIDLKAAGVPQLFVTDTLSDPHATFESGQGIYKEISRQQATANEIKRAQPITVVIGNPPYKEKAKGKGSWIENGRFKDGRDAPLRDWQPPVKWGVGAHAKHLRNLYVYFWRWAAWKVFEQGSGGRDKTPPVAEHLSGLVCYITVSGFLNGPGFQKMRADLRRDCDEIWVIDCSPEGHQPEVATRIFEGVQHPVCIVLASRSPDTKPKVPARVSYRALAKGRREAKFAELAALTLASQGWVACAAEPRAPFLPAFTGGWADFVPLGAVLGDGGSGSMPGRTWIIAPDEQSIAARWARLIGDKDEKRRAAWFHPHEGGDKTITKKSRAFADQHGPLASIEFGLLNFASTDSHVAAEAKEALRFRKPVRYGFRSFDRQWIVPDNRLINRSNPGLWESFGRHQIFLTGSMDLSPGEGPALTISGIIPDLHHFAGRGGRVFPLWRDAVGTQTNVAAPVIAALTKLHGAAPDPVDVFAYVAALLAHPAYTERFRADLVRPGLRVPLSADRALFDEAALIGREVIWLHSFGDRMADGRPAGPPRLPSARRPKVTVTIPATPDGFPDAIDWNADTQELKVGTGRIGPVGHAMWTYQVSGKQVLRQWFSYRKKNRERPQIGDRRPPSPLGDIQPDHWLPEYTEELLNVLNVLGLLIDREPRQADVLERIVDGPLVPAGQVGGGAE